jgi:hypothetical protein
MNIFKILVILFFTTIAHAAPGCRDNSWHLARPFDNKEDHLVANDCCGHTMHCQCPCKKLNYKGYCNDCGHFRYMQPWHIIRTPKVNS